MSNFYGKYFKWGVVGQNHTFPDPLNSCFVVLDWPRIMPNEDGTPDMAALNEYKTRLENYMLDGKRPVVILSDGTLPQYIAENGGWDKRETAELYLEYAKVCFEELADCAEQWVTFEELTAKFFILSRESGKFTIPHKPELQRLHNMLVAHGTTVKFFRSRDYFGKIGIGLSLAKFIPATPTKQDKRAAKIFDLLCNRWVPSMLDHGMYPYFSSLYILPFRDIPLSKRDDPETIAAVNDFVLVSFHGAILVSEQKTDEVLRYRHAEIVDETASMQFLMKKMYRKTKLPIYIWDRHFAHTAEAEKAHEFKFSQIENLLLDWVDIRGYFIPCKNINEPNEQYLALLKYLEKH